MNEKQLRKQIDRVGIVTTVELVYQTGAAGADWQKAVTPLLVKKEAFLCRLDHGQPTLISLHLLFCLRAVYAEPSLSPQAQDVYDWLSDNELAFLEDMLKKTGYDRAEFVAAFKELQQKLCVAPMPAHAAAEGRQDLGGDPAYLWGTEDYWLQGVHRPSRYSDLGYCLAEIKRLLKNHFSSREIDALIYKGIL